MVSGPTGPGKRMLEQKLRYRPSNLDKVLWVPVCVVLKRPTDSDDKVDMTWFKMWIDCCMLE